MLKYILENNCVYKYQKIYLIPIFNIATSLNTLWDKNEQTLRIWINLFKIYYMEW